MGWMLGAALILALLGSLTYEVFFLASLIGFLVIVELTALVHVTPKWRKRLKWFILAGLSAFAYLVVERIPRTLPEGLI